METLGESGIEAWILKIRALLNPRLVAQCVEVAGLDLGHMDRRQQAKCGQALRCFYKSNLLHFCFIINILFYC